MWPSTSFFARANVWRILDLSGLTNSQRQSRNYTRAGFVFLDGKAVRSLKETVELGRVFTLSLRFPNGVVREEEIMLVHTENHTGRRPITARQLNYKG